MRISLIGNCQMKTLTWYLQQLGIQSGSLIDAKFIFTELGMGYWAKRELFPFQPELGREPRCIPTVVNQNQARIRLLNSDYIIYQPIRPSRIPEFNYKDIQKYGSNAKLISVGCFYCKSACTRQMTDNEEYEARTGLLGMKERAEKFNLDIQPHKIIEKHGIDSVATKHAYHPKALYFLDLVREICAITGLNYYPDEQYNQYLAEGFPFG